MLLKSLSLENIRSYKKLSLEFPPGYTLFVGDVGSGKSTILMAVEFALFGLGSLKADSLISKGANRGEVALRFEVDGVSYEVGRALTRKDGKSGQDSKNSYLYCDGSPEPPLTPTDLKARILEILGFRESPNPRAASRVYRYAVYTPQEEIKAILDGRDREETIRRAFGMEDYKVAAENAKAIHDDMRRDMAGLEGRFAGLDSLQERRRAASDEAAAQKSSLADLEGQEGRLAEEEDSARDTLDAMAERAARGERLRSKKEQMEKGAAEKKTLLDGYQSAIKNGKVRREEIAREIQECRDVPRPTSMTKDELDAALRAMEETGREAAAAKSRMERSRREADTLDRKLGGRGDQDIRDMAERFQGEISAGEEELARAEGLLREYSSREGGVRRDITSLEQDLQRASSLGARCEYCDTPLDAKYVEGLVAGRQGRLDAARAELDTVGGDMKRCEADASRIRKRVKGARAALAGAEANLEDARRRAGAQAEHADAADRLASLEAVDHMPSQGDVRLPGESPRDRVLRLRDALARHEAAVSRMSALEKEDARMTDQIQESQNRHEAGILSLRLQEEEIDHIAGELEEYSTIPQEIAAQKSRLEDIRRDRALAREGMAECRTILRGCETRMAELDADIREARGHKARHKTLDDHARWLRDYFVPSLGEIERRAMESARYMFDEAYGRWYSMLVDDTTKTSRIDDRFGPVLEQDGYVQDVDHLSGGEKTSVSLAYRLAINSTMRAQAGTLRSNLLILDEPTDGFSGTQMQKVRTILDSVKSDQIVMVSHQSELEGYVEHVFRVTKSDGISAIQRAG